MQFGEPWITTREKHRVMGDKEWLPWFAWYPVRLNDRTWVWWEDAEYTQPMRYNIVRYRKPQ